MGEDFRGFLKEMEETKEGGFVRIKKEVDTRYEIAAIVTSSQNWRGPGEFPFSFSRTLKERTCPWWSTAMPHGDALPEVLGS
jgi:hypothetical protein